MTVAILGDSSFITMLSSEEFSLGLTTSFHPVTTLQTLRDYKALLPAGVDYVIVGSLTSFLGDLRYSKIEKREITLKRFVIEVGNAASGILEAHPNIRMIMVNPTYRTSPSTYKSDLVQIKVMSIVCPQFLRVGHQNLGLFQPFLAAMDQSNPRLRVSTSFSMDSDMLHRDGVSMTSKARKSYLSFLSSEITDLIENFRATVRSQQGQDRPVDQNANETRNTGPITSTPAQTTPAQQSSGEDSSLGWAEAYRTPPHPPAPPKSGVY
jgi:hypothetical protein